MNIISTQYTLANRSFEIYLAGCNAEPHCEDCFSPETWDFSMGEPCTSEKAQEIINKVREFGSMIDHVWFLGGDPIDQDPEELFALVNALKILKAEDDKQFWLFTRHELFDEGGYLKPEYSSYYNVLHYMDYIKTGAYVPTLAVDNRWINGIRLATSNQKIWAPIWLRGPIQLRKVKYSPQMPPRTESAQWVELPVMTCKNGSYSWSTYQLEADRRHAHDKYEYEPAAPNLEVFNNILRRMYERDNHCPCAIKRDSSTVCMCEEFRNMDEGVCRCGLYRKRKREGDST